MQLNFLKRILSSLILIPITIFVIINGSNLFNFFLIACYVLTIFEWRSFKINKIFIYIGYVFLTLAFFLTYKLRFDFDNNYTFLLSSIFVCILTDIGGYLFGKLLKGPKLTKISPNKTYSGLIGSYLLPILVFNILSNHEIYINNVNLVFFDNIYIILIISTLSQLGDLLVSYFKRLSKIKDTGNLIPGHGGLLDRIDGMLIALPCTHLILISNLFNIIK